MSVGLVVGVVGAIAVAITSPWWGPHLFGARWLAVATGCALGWLLYAVFNALNGAACGEQQWTAYALSVATDSGARLALVVAALGLGFGIVGQTWALALAGFAWVPLLAHPAFGRAWHSRGDRATKQMVAAVSQLAVAAACSSVMLAGFPVLVRVTSTTGMGPEAGTVLAAVTATRAPLLFLLGSLQAVLLTRFLTEPELVPRRLVQVTGLLLGAGLLLAAGGWLVGPWLMTVVFGRGFVITGVAMAALVVAAALLAVQSVTALALIARDRPGSVALGWLLSVGVAAALLTLDLPIVTRVWVALLVAPVSALVVNLLVLQRTRPAGAPPPEPDGPH